MNPTPPSSNQPTVSPVDPLAQPTIDTLLAQILPLFKEYHSGTRDRITVGQLLSGLIASLDHDPRELGSFKLEQAFDHYVGTKIMALSDDLLWLHAELVRRGYTEQNRFDFGYADRYAFALLDTSDRKAFTCQTQNMNYLVLLERTYQGWAIHLRQWWEPVKSHHASHYAEDFQSIRRKTYADVVRMADEAARHFSDHLPGVDFVQRPDLAMYQQTNFTVGSPLSCPGLRYGDLRDAGYLMSVRWTPFDQPEGDRALGHYSDLKYVLYDLVSAIETVQALPAPTTTQES